ncbi:MAG: glycoside hydrolase family 2 protein [Candidatus Limiplasma sp.]|nr:glycoside hydrolase family 2 protein [Candidatus Limiplasma sp.]
MVQRLLLRQAKLQGFSRFDRSTLTGDPCTPEWPVSLPRDVHTALLEAGLIPDPRFLDQSQAVSWVEERIWVYAASLSVSWNRDTRYELWCEGLDTYCALLVNGRAAASTANMLIPHRLDITAFVRDGENTLHFVFDVMKERASLPLPEGFWINASTERAYCRKAAFQYGWDWCPRLCTVGIWRPVSLVASAQPFLLDCFLEPLEVSADRAHLRCSAALCAPAQPGDVLCFALEGGGQRAEIRMAADAESCMLTLEHPRLWWCHDLGEPFLYQASVTLSRKGETLDRKSFPYGVRQIRLVQRDGETGANRFRFELNGIPLYAKGANWVPVDMPLTLPDREDRLRTLVALAKDAGMNMLNLWGGGIYEADLFYELCDREGLLLWQYFMFACGEAPDFDPAFVEAAMAEAECAVRRLRNHASIALWTGNVEAQMLCQKIGLQRPMHGMDLFENRLPRLLAELDPSRAYWPSSPFGGALCNSETQGDRHNWDIWFQKVPYTDYRKDDCLFASEFGVHAPPHLSTLRRYLPTDQLHPQSYGYDRMNYDSDPSRMTALLQYHTGVPAGLKELVNLGMLMQSDALRTAVEHYRLNMPQNGGALIWQLGDAFPCHSWSMIDYDLVPKASYYAAKQFFAPVSLILHPKDEDTTEVYLSNTTREAFQQEITLSVRGFGGEILWQERIPAGAEPYAVRKLYELRVGGRYYPNVILPLPRRFFYVHAHMEGWGDGFRFFAEYKDLRLPRCRLACRRKERGGQLLWTVSTDCFAKLVHLEGDVQGLRVDHNYFDLPAGSSREITVERLWGPPLPSRNVWLEALNEPRQEGNAHETL